MLVLEYDELLEVWSTGGLQLPHGPAKCCLGFQGATLSYDHHRAITIIAALHSVLTIRGYIGTYFKALHCATLHTELSSFFF